MTDLNTFKVPVFPSINDRPRVPTAQQAGNASDLIARFNGLAEAAENRINSINGSNIKTSLSPGRNFYVNSATGNDANVGGTESLPYKTIAKLVSVLNASLIDKEINLYFTGTFTESLDLSKVEGIPSLSQTQTGTFAINIFITGNGTGTLSFTSDNQFLLPSKNECSVYIEGTGNGDILLNKNLVFKDIDIYFYNCDFKHSVIRYLLQFINSVVYFNTCTANLSNSASIHTSFCWAINSQVSAKGNTISNVKFGGAVYRIENSIFFLRALELGSNNNSELQLRDRSTAYFYGNRFPSNNIDSSEGSTIKWGNASNLKATNTQVLTLYLATVAVGVYSVCWTTPFSGKVSRIGARFKSGDGSVKFLVNSTEVNTLTGIGTTGSAVNVFYNNSYFSQGDSLNVEVLSHNAAQGLQVMIAVEAD